MQRDFDIGVEGQDDEERARDYEPQSHVLESFLDSLECQDRHVVKTDSGFRLVPANSVPAEEREVCAMECNRFATQLIANVPLCDECESEPEDESEGFDQDKENNKDFVRDGLDACRGQ